MADNFVSGTVTFASDDISSVHTPRAKMTWGVDGVATDVSEAAALPIAPQGEGVSYWPGYKAPTSTADARMGVDPGGALVTRGAVTTDEGTFRVNFANTSLAVALGSVTVSGTTVTGSGFLAADVHLGDYFKLDADAESAWAQIEFVESDTTISLTTAYTGGVSGAASRALVVPVTQEGGGYSVASGLLTMTSGTTSGGGMIIGRIMDYGPLVYRARLSISQRVANNETRIGLAEPVTVTQPRWTSRFIADGTVNTTIKCESSRNPTQAPSAAETEITTVTIPNGLTTATSLDYRIEQLTESVRFYINGVLLAEHSKVMPSQSDNMVASVRTFNTGVPASSTTLLVDFITVKNHNKLEIGVMSEAERIVAASAPLQQFDYNVAGVISINTVLTVVDCSQIRALYIQCVSMGTTGVVTPQWSNNGVNWVTASLLSEAGVGSTTFNGAVLRYTNVVARYFRLILTTATTAGATTITIQGSQNPCVPIVPTQPVSGTVTANIGTGALAAGANLIGDVGMQVRTASAGGTLVHHAVAAATTNAAIVKASAGRLYGWSFANTTAAWVYVKLHNIATAPTAGAGVIMTIGVPPNGVAVQNIPAGVGFTTGIGRTIVTGAADADATATAANAVVGDIFYA